MKVLLVNGSQHKDGCTHTALREVASELERLGIETEDFWCGNKAIMGCIGCGKCSTTKRCWYNDDTVNAFLDKVGEVDGFVFGTPVHFAGPSGFIKPFMDRAFCSKQALFFNKPASVIVSCRRGGAQGAFEDINRYFTISFIGQNYGAGKLDRVNRVFWICLGLAALTCALANWSFTWQYHYVLSLFSSDPTVIDYGNIRMHTALAFQFIAATYEISGSAMRGMGKSVEPTIITIIGTCLLRMVWVFMILPQYNDFFHLMMIYPISWAITGTLMLILYAAHWRKVKKMAL